MSDAAPSPCHDAGKDLCVWLTPDWESAMRLAWLVSLGEFRLNGGRPGLARDGDGMGLGMSTGITRATGGRAGFGAFFSVGVQA